ncbi:MAG: HlyD family type I secretion periplasmic adaptor subunit [Magnetococcales bacterium]|nr:HlyD family type I secretion periplasmic adaptor subunit [Magnetococcales bacterium]
MNRYRQQQPFTDIYPLAHGLLLVTVLCFVVMVVWASWAELDEVTTGEGRVIPSGQVQLVQNLEGGILAELLVHEGDVVEKGQVLLRIDDTQFSASFRESSSRSGNLKVRIARLEAEIAGKGHFVPERKLQDEELAELIRSEQELFTARRQELESATGILRKQVAQKEQELLELASVRNQLSKRLALVRKELAITEPMVKQGVMSSVELLRLQREEAELEGQQQTATLTVPRVEMALKELRSKAEEPAITFRTRAQAELNEAKAELRGMSESMTALKDRVTRTAVRSPVHGSVIRVRVNTIGQVVRAGVDLVEIMPLEESLLVEARVRPADIAFLRPGQEGMVKLTAYDFSIYGGLPGRLSHISADTITDEKGEHHYLVQVRTQKNHLGTEDHPLPIIPGMVATVDVLTGRKSVLDYLLKPILKVKQNALRER